jgi:hypothetical protein
MMTKKRGARDGPGEGEPPQGSRQLRLPPKLINAIRAAAAIKGMEPSELVGVLVLNYVKAEHPYLVKEMGLED